MASVITLGPVGYNPTGTYNNSREYEKLDVVTYQGSSYVAITNSVGKSPLNTTYWNLVAEKGETPTRGEDYWTEEDQQEVVSEAVTQVMSEISVMEIEVVQTLPTSDIKTNTIYLVPKSSTGTNNIYDEYLYINNSWELIGDTEVDLSGYQPKIDNLHKLSADLVDDTNTTNKFVASSDKTTWNAKYDKPSGGIPKTDLSSAVQTSLGKADTAVQDVSGKEDKSNKVTSISSSSTDTQYPSAKCVYDIVGDIETLLTTLDTGNGV